MLAQSISGTSSGGITNAAGNNVIPKSNGANLIGSLFSDTGTIGSTTDNEFDIGPADTVSNGVLGLKGKTSGTATLTAPAVAGTVTNALVSSNAINLPAGTALLPSLNAVGATTTGFYFPANAIGFTVNAAEMMRMDTNGVTSLNMFGSIGFGPNNNSFDSTLNRSGVATLQVGSNGNNSSGSLKMTNLFVSGTVQNVAATATMGLTLKKGTGVGNYTTASTTYVHVGASELCDTVTIPTGWKLGIVVNAALGTATGAVVANLAISDNASCTTDNAGILVETTETTTAAATLQAIGLSWVVTGDGASHNIALQFKTSNGADSATILNTSSTSLPTVTYLLIPSN